MVDYVLSLLLGEAFALEQCINIRAGGPLFNFRAQFVKILLKIRSELFVVPRSAGVRRQKEHEGKIVAGRSVGGLEIENAGDQHDSVECDAMFYQVPGKASGARGAVTFTHHEERR